MCLFKAESVGPTFFSVDEEKEITRLEKIELEYENDFLQLLENWDSGSEWSASNKHGFNVFIKNLKGDSWKRWIKFLQDKEKYQQLAIEAIVRFKDKKGQLLQDVIEHDIKAILFKRIIFLGQFKLEDGSPIHKCATALVLKATDLNTNEYYLDFFLEAQWWKIFYWKK